MLDMTIEGPVERVRDWADAEAIVAVGDATIRKRIVNRAARITRPAGRLVLTLAKNSAVEHAIERLLKPWIRAA